jgi:hypothetical protein
MSQTNVLQNFIAGGVGGMCTIVIGQPFDTIKVSFIPFSGAIYELENLGTYSNDASSCSWAKGFYKLQRIEHV